MRFYTCWIIIHIYLCFVRPHFNNSILCLCVTVMNVSFGAPRFSVVEGKGFAELVLTKTPGAVGPVSVNLFTVDGSAG